MAGKQQLGEELLTPGAVAALIFVDRKTVARRVQTGKLDAIRTPGGHHRFRTSDVAAIRAGTYERRAPATATEDAEPSAEALAAAVVAEAVAVALEAEAQEAAMADERLREQALAAADRAATRVQIRADVAASQVAAVASAALEQLLAEGEDVAGDRVAILDVAAGLHGPVLDARTRPSAT